MTETKRTQKRGDSSNAGFQKLKQDIKEQTLGCAYIFYGDESYLREHYLSQVRKTLIPEGFEAFNFHVMEGKDLTAERLAETAEAMPMMAERTLIVVKDWDLFKLGEEQRSKLIVLLDDLPEYVCIIFVYATLEYKRDKSMKKLCKAMDDHVQEVQFRPAEKNELETWIIRHFRALGKEIDRGTAGYLMFLCGTLMTGLLPEIEKIAAYTKGKNVTQRDIDAVADPILSAKVFQLSDAITEGDQDRAFRCLSDLLKMQEEPIMILSVLGSQLRQLYTARIAVENGKDIAWLMELWNMRYDYGARKLMSAARRTTRSWCSDAVKMCQVLDRRLKSEKGIDGVSELKLLVVKLGATRK